MAGKTTTCRAAFIRCTGAVFAALTALAWLLPACDRNSDACGEPVYGGDATDEALRTMLDGEQRAHVGDANAPNITVPAEGRVFPAGDPPARFTWTSPIAQAPRSHGTRRVAHLGSSRATRHSWVDRVSSLLIGTAYAHLPPVTGDIYYLQIDIPGRSCPYRVLTTNLDWQVDDEGWAAMKEAAGQTISIRIISAYLTENRITEGPFQPAAPRTFKVQ